MEGRFGQMKLPNFSMIAGLSSAFLHAVIVAALHAFGVPPAPPRAQPIAMEIRRPKPRPEAPPPLVVPEAPPLAAPRKPEPVRRSAPRPAVAPVTPVTPVVQQPTAAAAPDAISVAPAPAAPATAPPGDSQAASPVTAPPAAAPRPGVAGGKGVDLSAYLGQINRVVAARRRYPPMAIEMQLEGDAVVSVRLNRDGSLASRPTLARSSGHELLDSEALRMVTASAPFPPLPAGYLSATADMQIPVRFRLED